MRTRWRFERLREVLAGLLLVMLIPGWAWSQVYLPEDAVKLDVQLKGPQLHFSIRNVSPYDIQVFDDFHIYSAPYHWPYFTYIQIRDSSGRIVTIDKQGRPTLWTPWTGWSQAVYAPAKLGWLRAGSVRKTEADLEKCLKRYARTHFKSFNRIRRLSDRGVRARSQGEFLRSFDSIKIFFSVKMDPMLSESLRLETDWLKLDHEGWFIGGSRNCNCIPRSVELAT